MSEQKKFIDNDNYLRCSTPFETPEEASAALEAFWNEFYELRNKHRVSDVLLTFRIQVRHNENGVHEHMGSLFAGSEMFTEALAAWALGKAQAERQERIAGLLSQGMETRAVTGKQRSKK
jgi:hypothetical protein